MSLIIYLHGFNSGPMSAKISFFKKKFEYYDIGVIAPNLNLPSFPSLSVKAMISHLADIIENNKDEDLFIIASSLGATVILNYLKLFPDNSKSIKKIVLLAPSLNFFSSNLYKEQIVPKLAENLPLIFYHSLFKKNLTLSNRFLEEIEKYSVEDFRTSIPCLLIHGKNDEIIDFNYSVEFAKRNSNVLLQLVNDDHRLLTDLDNTWSLIKNFLEIQDFFYIEKLNLDLSEDLQKFEYEQDKIFDLLSKTYEDYLGDEMHRNRFLLKKGYLYIARQGDSKKSEILGVCHILQSGKIRVLGILPEFQRKGIGGALLSKSFVDFKYLYGEVRNEEIKILLKKSGFETVSKISEVLSILGNKESLILEMRRTSDGISYLRRSSSLKNVFYNAEILKKSL